MRSDERDGYNVPAVLLTPIYEDAVMPCRIAFFVACCFLLSGMAIAQQPRTIQVTGAGTAEASPNYLLLTCTLTENGESAEEAAANFAKEKERVSKLLDAGRREGFDVQFTGEKLTSAAVAHDAAAAAAVGGFGGAAPAAGGGFTVSEEITLRLPIENDMQREGIVKKLAETVDGLKKAGLTMGSASGGIYAMMGLGGSSGILQFGLDEAGDAKLRDKAYAGAFRDARTRAESLAQLSGGKLGKVVAVKEVAAPVESDNLQEMQMSLVSQMFGGNTPSLDGDIDRNGQIELRQQISVTFELVE